MNDTQNTQRAHVVPKWAGFSKTSKKGELIVPRKKPFVINEYTSREIDAEYQEYKQNPSVQNALSLLGSALVTANISLAHDAASFLKSKRSASKTTIDFADKILHPGKGDESEFETALHITKIKEWLNKYPKSALHWIELARLYAISGQHAKAKRAVVIALNLAPFDRYVVRCGVRFFIHILDFDSAWHYIHKANAHAKDPWLKATEMNVALIADKSTPSFRKLLPKDLSGDALFHYSELFESCGILELRNGKSREAKKLFKTAWTSPCETVITHGEWVIRNRFPGLRENSNLQYEKSSEALTWIKYFDLDLTGALSTAKEWEIEEPYSRGPFVLGASIACCAGLPDMAIEIAQRGLKANPDDPKILNNLCYAFLRAGRISDAEDEFKKYVPLDNDEAKIFYLATKGLLEIKKGNLSNGRNHYLESIRLCKLQGDRDLVAKAYLNLALAELEALTLDATKTVEIALSMSEGSNQPDVRMLRKQIAVKLEEGAMKIKKASRAKK